MRPLALLPAAALCTIALAACDSEVSEPPFLPETSPTATVAGGTPTPEPAAAGMLAFRQFAPLIEAALAEGNASFFAERAVEQVMTCGGDEEIGPCAGAAAGTELRGLLSGIAQTDALALLSPREYTQALADWLATAAPDEPVTLHALAHSPTGLADEEAYQAIVFGRFLIGPPDEKVLRQQGRILDFALVEGEWQLTGDLYASVPETIRPYLRGDCDECYDHWERWEGQP